MPRRYTIEPIIMENPREYRKTNPGEGVPKLHAILKKLFYDTGCFPGRDAYREMLRKHRLYVSGVVLVEVIVGKDAGKQ